MQRVGKIAAVSAVLGFLILMVCPVSAGPAGDRISGLLDRLAGEGYDLIAIESALASGDNATVRSLMDQFREEHADAFPAPHADGMPGNRSRPQPPAEGMPENCNRMEEGLLNMLDQQGYDVSAIASALASGDMASVHTLMDEFRDANQIELPAPPADGMAGNSSRMDNLLNMLGEQGYDVSSIESALASGDMATAHTLMEQFRESNRIEIPAPPIGDRPEGGRGISGLLDTLEEQGYDVSAIQSAAESGDITSACTLMQQFVDANKIVQLAPPAEGMAGNGWMNRNIQAFPG